MSGVLEAVSAALEAVEAEGDTATVAVKLARRIDLEGASPSTVRECRYAMVALGVRGLAPYRALLQATMDAIDKSDTSLPSLSAQARETEQLLRKLSAEPVNQPEARLVREATDALVAQWDRAWAEHVAGVETDWEAHRAESLRLHRVVDEAGGEHVYPGEVQRAADAWTSYWQRRIRRRWQLAGFMNTTDEAGASADLHVPDGVAHLPSRNPPHKRNLGGSV